mmetsp:Transcript_328/g.695  ORF Transcript_328/g.695 Transcript_328/m.695 type:complete len:331 (+) Transcript_328:625-1617(+)
MGGQPKHSRGEAQARGAAAQRHRAAGARVREDGPDPLHPPRHYWRGGSDVAPGAARSDGPVPHLHRHEHHPRGSQLGGPYCDGGGGRVGGPGCATAAVPKALASAHRGGVHWPSVPGRADGRARGGTQGSAPGHGAEDCSGHVHRAAAAGLAGEEWLQRQRGPAHHCGRGGRGHFLRAGLPAGGAERGRLHRVLEDVGVCQGAPEHLGLHHPARFGAGVDQRPAHEGSQHRRTARDGADGRHVQRDAAPAHGAGARGPSRGQHDVHGRRPAGAAGLWAGVPCRQREAGGDGFVHSGHSQRQLGGRGGQPAHHRDTPRASCGMDQQQGGED